MTQQNKAVPSKSIDFTFKGKSFTVEFPKTGKHIDMLSYKARLAKGQYESISATRDIDNAYGKALIDAVVFFEINCPELIKAANVSSLLDLEALDMRELIECYLSTIIPWYNEWIVLLNTPIKQKEESTGD